MFLKNISVLLLSFLICFQVFSQELVPQVGVLKFSTENLSIDEVGIIENIFTSRLVSTNIFNVIDRKNMDSLLKEIELQVTGLTETKRAVEIGNFLAINYMIIGSVSKLDNSYVLNVQLLNVQTAQIVGSSVQMFESLSAAKEMIDIAVVEITGLNYSELASYESTKSEYQRIIKRFNSSKSWLITGISMTSVGLIGCSLNYFIFQHPMHFTNVFGIMLLGSGGIVTTTSAIINLIAKDTLNDLEIEMKKYSNFSISPILGFDLALNINLGLVMTYVID